MNTSSRLPWIVLGTTAAVVTIVVVGVVLAATALGGLGQPTPLPSATLPLQTPAPGAITGRVWHDLCAVSGGEAGLPASPGPGCVPAGDGGYTANGLLEPGEPGLAGISVALGLGACPVTAATSAQTDATGAYRFPDLPAGAYCVSVDSLFGGNSSLLPGEWSSPSGLGAAALAEQTVTLPQGIDLIDVNFGWDYQFLPEPAVTPTVAAPSPTPGAAGCIDSAAFVQDVTVPDNTLLQSGQEFEKVWRLRNNGTCTWNSFYSLVFASGDAMGGPASLALPGTVAPGQTVDLRVSLRAPTRNGTFRGNWLLRNPSGQTFGTGSSANAPFWVQVVVGPTPTPARNAWRGEYFASRNLFGAPALIRSDSTLDFDWAGSAPAPGLPADDFSVRWTRRLTFGEGTYRLHLTSDDGARLWIDGRLVIDQWTDGSTREATVDLSLRPGDYDFRVEYYEHTGDARALLRWEPLTSPSYPEWRGEYWFDAEMSSRLSLVRNDHAIDFDWVSGSPAAILPSDNFSARWTRTVTFDSGIYRFNAIADDGIRIYLDGLLLIDEWHDSSGTQTYTAQRTLEGAHQVLVAYYEHGGTARVRFWWERAEATSTATSTATIAPTATATSTIPATTETPTASATPSPTEPATFTATPSLEAATDTSTPTFTATPETPTETATETPTPTATETPTPTATATNTPEATVTPTPELVYDLIEGYCYALWSGGAGDLPCPGVEGHPSGYVLLLPEATLETGELAVDVLHTHPQNVSGGFIEGVYTPITFQGNERLEAVIGCLSGQPLCSVTFEVLYLTTGETPRSLARWSEMFDGATTEIRLDLSSLAGQTVPLILRVEANASPEQASAFWLRARVVR